MSKSIGPGCDVGKAVIPIESQKFHVLSDPSGLAPLLSNINIGRPVPKHSQKDPKDLRLCSQVCDIDPAPIEIRIARSLGESAERRHVSSETPF
jgi:hypothetical protein